MNLYRSATRIIPDKHYISWQFRRHLGYDMNWEKPETFNEKIQWLKLNWNDPLATKCADKYAVRSFVEQRMDQNILNEIYGVYASVDDIDISKLPNSFVLKGTHGSGMNIICQNKNELDWDKARIKMKRWLKTNYYNGTREWVYKDIKPQIICEKFLEGKNGEPPLDYKFLCFNGEPLMSFVCLERFKELKVDFYDLEWNKLPFSRHYPNSSYEIPMPDNYEEMIQICRKLAEPFPFVRVDLYEVKGKIFFGELTFFPGNGMEGFTPTEYDKILGQYFNLPN